MTISSEISRMDYVGNGVTTIHPYTFKIVDQTHLVVTKRVLGVETTLVLNTDYTVSGVGAQSGGNVTLTTALANGIPLVIRRVVPLLQLTDIKNQGAFYPEIHEDEFDAIVTMVQQQQEEINRSVKVPVTGGSTPETYLASLSAFVTAFLAGIADVAAAIHAAGSKATPIDADELGIWDSVTSTLKKLTWANLKATLGSTFAALAGLSSQVFSVGAATSAAHAIRLDQQQIPWRNRIINGDMSVSQVNGTTAVTPTASGYHLDQWQSGLSVASKLTFQQVADAPAGFKYSLKVTVNAQYAPAAGETFRIGQPLEGQNLIDLGFGTANNRRIATSLWIKGSVAGTYAIHLQNMAQDRSYVGTIAVTTGWTQVVITLDADSSGVWNTDNTNGLQLYLDLGSGTNFNTAGGAWVAGNYRRTAGAVTFVNQVNGSTLNITGVQVEKVASGATVGTEFEFISFAEQLRRCERYLETSYSPFTPAPTNASAGYVVASADSTKAVNAFVGQVRYRVTKRANPTLTIYSHTSSQSGRVSNGAGADLAASSGIATGGSIHGAGVANSSGGILTPTDNAFIFHYIADARM